MYGILVIGAPGAGKSTFCTGLSDIFSQLKRDFCIFNLDPANNNNEYDAHFDIKELITVEEVMDRLELGPNGALKYCIETLCRNPGYDPLFVGATLDNNNDGDVNIRFSPPK